MASNPVSEASMAEVRLELMETPSSKDIKLTTGTLKKSESSRVLGFEGLLGRKEENLNPMGQLRRKSRWLKLKNTVKVASAMSGHVRGRNRALHSRSGGSTLTREDSFMKRFSTRQNHSSSIHRNHQIHPNSTTLSHNRLAKSFSSSSTSRLRHESSNHTSDNEDAASKETSAASDQVSIEGFEEDRKEEDELGSSRFILPVFQPDGCFLFYWLALLTSAILYNLWTPIAREAFPELNQACPAAWLVADIICDVIYLTDVAVQFRTGYLERGLIVYDGRKLARNYTRSKHFLLDLASLTPLDLLQIYFSSHPILRFMRFLKSYRVYRFVYMVETRTAYPNLWRVVNLSHVLFLGCHWFAAFYYLISMAQNFETKWSYPTPVGNYSSVAQKYLRSLYWSTLTLTTIGDLTPPETNWEHVFTIVSYLIGVFVFATIVGQVGNVITNRNASRQEFEKLLDGAKAYMRHHSVPDEMQRHVQRWYDYAWSRGCMNGGGDINALGLLPDKLKTELALHVNLETLKKVTIFHECEPEFLHDLVLKMRTYIFTPGDLICRKGEVAREMFIIADGLLEVLSESGEILSKMSAGDFFGEIGILNMDGGVNKRTADVRSLGYSELIVLSRDDVLSALRDHPEAESLIKEYGHRRLHELGARRKRNLNTESGVVSQLVGNIVGLKKPLASTDPVLGQSNGNKIESETASQQFSIPKTSHKESSSSLNEFPAKNETYNVHQLMSGFETTQHVQQSSCNQKTSSRKSSYSGSKDDIVTDKSVKDEEIRPLTKTTTTDTLISNGSSVLACFMSEPVGLNCEAPPLTNLHILTQKPSAHQSGEQNERESLDSYPEISKKMRKASFGNQLSTQSEDVIVRPSAQLEFESKNNSVFTEWDKIIHKLSSLEMPPTKCDLASWENPSDVDEQMFPVDELSSTIAACMKHFFESRLQNLKTRVTLLEADNLAKSQQIQVLNSMLEQVP